MRRYSTPARDVFLRDFDTHGDTFLKRLREQFPLEYSRTIARIMSTEPDRETSDSFETWTSEERVTACEKAREVLDARCDPMETLRNLRVIMAGMSWGVVIHGKAP